MLPMTKYLILLCAGVLLLSAGLVFIFPEIYDRLVEKRLLLIPTNKEYFQTWQAPTIPIYMTFYFFNCTNAENVTKHKAKPILEELGPYVFREYRFKDDLDWHSLNGTISFALKQTWYFVPEYSNGDLEDNITSLNVPVVSAVYQSRMLPSALRSLLSIAMTLTGNDIFIELTVRELLYDGYNSSFLNFIKKIKKIPMDEFAWFYQRNGTDSPIYNIFTGEMDTSKLGITDLWNGSRHLPYWKDNCSLINGTDGDIWPPGLKPNYIDIFISDICRSLSFYYEEDEVLYSITGRKYRPKNNIFDNSTRNHDNYCFETGDESVSGLFNISLCKFGCPIFLSFPHFYVGDPSLGNAVIGLKPSANKHSSSIVTEPLTGVPLSIQIKFQLNVLLNSDSAIRQFEHVPSLYFPMLWFNQNVSLDDATANRLKLVAKTLPTALFISSIVAICISGLMIICATIFIARNLAQRSRRASKLSTTNLITDSSNLANNNSDS